MKNYQINEIKRGECPYCGNEVELEPTAICCGEVHGELVTRYEDSYGNTFTREQFEALNRQPQTLIVECTADIANCIGKAYAEVSIDHMRGFHEVVSVWSDHGELSGDLIDDDLYREIIENAEHELKQQQQQTINNNQEF